ncbi:GDSL-type esterase/lipase family protein [Domibacillus indicus]|uniref:DUF459 domain-containing protein n=1 Tax=Domibacillus indicus TaxID=1437523 RepID=UPI0020405843|nr:GDSL-type esterase/lipase family protein [Domibacillus indicus]MCM3791552.1 GDSL-type esterase/lipase family protein [Domibacillus indicus]
MRRAKITTVAVAVLIAVAGVFLLHREEENKAESPSAGEELVALGDSLTYGVGDQAGQGYTDKLEKVLNKQNKVPLTVYNYGIPGQQTDGLLQQLRKADVRKTLSNAEYFTIFIGTNDLIESNGGDLNPLYKDRIQWAEKDYRNNLHRILSIIQKENPDAPVLFLGLYNPYPDSEEIEAVITEWNKLSQDVVSQYPHVKFIATNGLLKEKSTDYFSDELHPNSKGYELITKKIIEEYNF